MVTIKVISNPYKREISFQKYDSASASWTKIDIENNPNSKLLAEEIVKNFFPYKVKQIVEQLVHDYIAGDDALTIVFEGTEDEYHELTEICKGFNNVIVERSGAFIENARDILPRIVDIFSEVQPIVDRSISSEVVRKEIDRDIAKFTDASNDIVPICVLGNYSSGKSTFINALIGQEILPSGDMPVTAKIYKVAPSEDDKKATIKFEYEGNPIGVKISDDNYEVQSTEGDQLADSIRGALNSNEDGSLSTKVSKCLDVVNKQRKGVSDLIDLVVPFGRGPLSDSKNTFVIFDTPGSNTATYKEHFDILKDAMKNLSNGVPIYVAEYNSLDSCDNEKLYESIKSISQIDARFTMIIVNKADMANIKEESFNREMEEMILEQAVPRNLYSGGIYFISSIMGLGSKNDGEFVDDHAAEFFEDNERKYSDPESRRYKQLYRYNIMPEQIKQRICNESEEEENKILANSGLLAIEHEIVNFAEKYSAYDKCNQSDKYISRIIDATQEEIEKTKATREANKKELEDELEEDKKKLIASMELKSALLTEDYKDAYNENLNEYYSKAQFSYTRDQIKNMEQEIQDENKKEHNYFDRVDDARESRDAILDNIQRIGQKSIGEFVRDLGDEIKDVFERQQELQTVKFKVDMETVDELLKQIADDFNERLDESITLVTLASRKYWEENAETIKKEQLMLVAESDTLDEEKKRELSDIITTYTTVKFRDDLEFEREKFEKKIRIFWKTIDLNKINTKKLTEEYNARFSERVGSATATIREKHSKSFDSWCNRLLDKIRSNIVSYSPKLSERARQIEEETQKIDELINTKNTLHDYSEQIKDLMDWKALT